MVGRSGEKLVKGTAPGFVALAMCIIRAIPKYYLREISVLCYSSADLHWNCTGPSERSSKSRMNVTGKEYVAALDLFSLVVVVIDMRPATRHSTVLVERA